MLNFCGMMRLHDTTCRYCAPFLSIYIFLGKIMTLDEHFSMSVTDLSFQYIPSWETFNYDSRKTFSMQWKQSRPIVYSCEHVIMCLEQLWSKFLSFFTNSVKYLLLCLHVRVGVQNRTIPRMNRGCCVMCSRLNLCPIYSFWGSFLFHICVHHFILFFPCIPSPADAHHSSNFLL